jgi:hypothetical protein
VVPELVTLLEPGQMLLDAFDPRLYCFSSEGQHVLVPGAIVTPHFGWAPVTKTTWKNGKKNVVPVEPQPDPFVAQTPSETDAAGAEPKLLKQLSGVPFALDSEFADWSEARLRPEEAEDAKEKEELPLSLELVRGSDAYADYAATVTLTLKNRSKERRRVYFRRELVSFSVLGTNGVAVCDAQPDTRAPDPSAFLSLSPGRTVTITSRLVELCPQGTFEHAGLYLVQARFDATERGRQHGLDAFVGAVESDRPATIRVRTGPPDAEPTSSMRVYAFDAR